MKDKSKKTLHEFIHEGIAKLGIDKFKHQFGATESSVYQWARGDNLPRPLQMEKIVKLSRGKVSYAEMVMSYLKKQKSK